MFIFYFQKSTSKQNIPIIEDYLHGLDSYLLQGGFINTFKVKQDKLHAKTVNSYISFI